MHFEIETEHMEITFRTNKFMQNTGKITKWKQGPEICGAGASITNDDSSALNAEHCVLLDTI